MINIYCLIDPRNKKPFYVGATKFELHKRLSAHISECKTYLPEFHNNKLKKINSILIDGNKPKIRLLISCPLVNADEYEFFFYSLLKSQGYELLNKEHSFNYNKKDKNWRFKRFKNQSIKKYSQLYYKDILIIIW